jgi:hypothetical protein
MVKRFAWVAAAVCCATIAGTFAILLADHASGR